MKYEHTQIGYFTIFILIVVSVIFTVIFLQEEFNLYVTLLLVFIWLVLASFTTLKVTIDNNELKIKFGYGLFRTKFNLSEITSVETAKNKWYFGYGIRFWFWPKMTIYNVSGFDAVEIKTKNNKTYRIGTDEPEKLKQAIQNSKK